MTAAVDSTACQRICRCCGLDKPIDAFPQVRGKAKGHKCKACVNESQNERRARRLGVVDKRNLAVRNADLKPLGKQECKVCGEVKPLEQYRLKAGRRTLACLDCLNSRRRQAYAENENGMRDRLNAHHKARRLTHRDRLNDQKREYVARNRQKVTDRQNEWAKRKLRNDPMFALKKRIRSLIGNAFASVGSSKNQETQAILGCSFEEFKAHLEKQFLPGMSWARMGREIHIDHIVPLATAKCEADVIALNHFTNLRPMWAPDNIRKGAKVLALL